MSKPETFQINVGALVELSALNVVAFMMNDNYLDPLDVGVREQLIAAVRRMRADADATNPADMAESVDIQLTAEQANSLAMGLYDSINVWGPDQKYIKPWVASLIEQITAQGLVA